jgi:hypothetical protein
MMSSHGLKLTTTVSRILSHSIISSVRATIFQISAWNVTSLKSASDPKHVSCTCSLTSRTGNDVRVVLLGLTILFCPRS